MKRLISRKTQISLINRLTKSGFTPLEKATDFSRWSSPREANGGIPPKADPCPTDGRRAPQAEKPPLAQTVRERSSLTGFTLVEALLSIVIISVGTIFILQTFGWELTTLGVARDNMRAAFLLEEKMAEIEKEIIEKGNLELLPISGKISAAGEKDFNWTMTLLPAAVSKGLTEVRLGCFWKSRGKTQSMTLATLVREKEN